MSTASGRTNARSPQCRAVPARAKMPVLHHAMQAVQLRSNALLCEELLTTRESSPSPTQCPIEVAGAVPKPRGPFVDAAPHPESQASVCRRSTRATARKRQARPRRKTDQNTVPKVGPESGRKNGPQNGSNHSRWTHSEVKKSGPENGPKIEPRRGRVKS